MRNDDTDIRIEVARESDAGIILDLIRRLAEYEKLAHAVVATEEQLRIRDAWLGSVR